ncbi:hypothetical protein M427DRAFT_65826 [Gonapodya prolifera JEL478]|uniref:Uncharacterized protein n=1 Tax=Gonapodya prolifera (strain JEL478) TaxID=1344416 RepID=A0A139AYU5_GONPJ|nr:hypothetical protein M427DRAFT_65826 [Gonapodya prolifera JEL478]|eukprot:KXS21928.1 hypothetical protein M427DRAFT_65826 [Gonapodya prolifera JEL478]
MMRRSHARALRSLTAVCSALPTSVADVSQRSLLSLLCNPTLRSHHVPFPTANSRSFHESRIVPAMEKKSMPFRSPPSKPAPEREQARRNAKPAPERERARRNDARFRDPTALSRRVAIPSHPRPSKPANERERGVRRNVTRFRDPAALARRVAYMVDHAADLGVVAPGGRREPKPVPGWQPKPGSKMSDVIQEALDLVIAHSRNPTIRRTRDDESGERGGEGHEGPSEMRNRPGVADAGVWNTFLGACARHGLMNWAFRGYNTMKNHGHAPDTHTYLHLLTAIYNSSLLPSSSGPSEPSHSTSSTTAPNPPAYASQLSRLDTLLSLVQTRGEMARLWTTTHLNATLRCYARWGEWDRLWATWGWCIQAEKIGEEDQQDSALRDPRTGKALRKYWRKNKGSDSDSEEAQTGGGRHALIPVGPQLGAFDRVVETEHLRHTVEAALDGTLALEETDLDDEPDVVAAQTQPDAPLVVPDQTFSQLRLRHDRDSPALASHSHPAPPSPITFHTMLGACARRGGREGVVGADIVWARLVEARQWCAKQKQKRGRGGVAHVVDWRASLPDARMVESYVRALTGSAKRGIRMRAMDVVEAFPGSGSGSGRHVTPSTVDMVLSVVLGACAPAAPAAPGHTDTQTPTATVTRAAEWLRHEGFASSGRVAALEDRTAGLVVGAFARLAVEAAAAAGGEEQEGGKEQEQEQDRVRDGEGEQEQEQEQEQEENRERERNRADEVRRAMETAWMLSRKAAAAIGDETGRRSGSEPGSASASTSASASVLASRARYAVVTAPIFDAVGFLPPHIRDPYVTQATEAWQRAVSLSWGVSLHGSDPHPHPVLVLAWLRMLLRVDDPGATMDAYEAYGEAAADEALAGGEREGEDGASKTKTPGALPATVSAVAKKIVAAGVEACERVGAAATAGGGVDGDGDGSKAETKETKELQDLKSKAETLFEKIRRHPLYSVKGGLGAWDGDVWEETKRGKFIERDKERRDKDTRVLIRPGRVFGGDEYDRYERERERDRGGVRFGGVTSGDEYERETGAPQRGRGDEYARPRGTEYARTGERHKRDLSQPRARGTEYARTGDRHKRDRSPPRGRGRGDEYARTGERHERDSSHQGRRWEARGSPAPGGQRNARRANKKFAPRIMGLEEWSSTPTGRYARTTPDPSRTPGEPRSGSGAWRDENETSTSTQARPRDGVRSAAMELVRGGAGASRERTWEKKKPRRG